LPDHGFDTGPHVIRIFRIGYAAHEKADIDIRDWLGFVLLNRIRNFHYIYYTISV